MNRHHVVPQLPFSPKCFPAALVPRRERASGSKRARRPRLSRIGDRGRRFVGGAIYAIYLLAALLLLMGCRPTSSPDPEPGTTDTDAPMAPLRVWMIDQADLGRAVERQWQAHAQQPISLREMSAAELGRQMANADVLIFPPVMLGRMVTDRQIAPWPPQRWAGTGQDDLDAATRDYDWPDVFASLRRVELRWGGEQYGVSFGSPQLVLMYRADLFEQWQLQVPETWEDYQRVVAAASKRIADLGDQRPVARATLEPLAPGWAARLLLARSAAYAQHPNQYSTLFKFTTLSPLIATAPFIRGLQELAADARQAPDPSPTLTPTQVTESFLAGDSAMAISWPTAAGTADATAVEGRFAIAALPGARQVYHAREDTWQTRADLVRVPLIGAAGQIGAVARRTRSAEASTSFLMWLTHREQAASISARCADTTLFRQSQVQQPTAWVNPPLASAAGRYATIVASGQQTSNVLMMPRLPGQADYLMRLDDAVHRVLQGDQTPDAALQQVADEWDKLTDSIGREQQQQAYIESLGLQ